MRTIRLPCGESVPALGQGTWNLGEDPSARRQEIESLRGGLDLGLTLIDTAEMYGEGRTETLVGEAIAGRRDEVFLVSKVYPHNASRRAMRKSCEASLRRLGTDRLDLYLLHWAGGVPIAETLEAFVALQRDGLIRHYGVSNLDRPELEAAWARPGGAAIQVDQVLYNLERRGVEWALAPWLRRQGVPLMAYSPLEQGRLLQDRRLAAFARDRGMTTAQAALGWLLAQQDVILIPKTARLARLQDNVEALRQPLDDAALAELDRLFPPPTGPAPLEMI